MRGTLGLPSGGAKTPFGIEIRPGTHPMSARLAKLRSMASEPLPSLSVPALHELRRIYTKHLLEVFATPETKELYDRGCIAGTFTEAAGDRSFRVQSVTPLGIATLEARERQDLTPYR